LVTRAEALLPDATVAAEAEGKFIVVKE